MGPSLPPPPSPPHFPSILERVSRVRKEQQPGGPQDRGRASGTLAWGLQPHGGSEALPGLGTSPAWSWELGGSRGKGSPVRPPAL